MSKKARKKARKLMKRAHRLLGVIPETNVNLGIDLFCGARLKKKPEMETWPYLEEIKNR